MIIRPDPTAGAGAATSLTATSTECGNCGTAEHQFLHNVRYRSAYRRVCTSCVLRLHPQHFCPTCFTVYPSAPPPFSADYLSCTRCYSFSHIHCLGSTDRSPYTCPLCVNPNSPIFTLKNAKDMANSEGVNGEDVKEGESRIIDKMAANILLAAAKIAAALMTKNAAEANLNAERRAREAAVARKRARDALDHLAYLVAKEKFMKKEAALDGVHGSGSGGLVGRRDNVNGAGTVSVNQMVNGVSGNVNNGVAGRMNGSNEALATAAAVQLREGERRKEALKVDKLQLGVRLNDLVPMDVDVKRELVTKEDHADDHVGSGGSAIEMPGSLQDNIENHGGEEERVGNGQVMAVPMEDHLEPSDNRPPRTDDY